MMESPFVAVAPLLVVTLGGILLMLTEVLAKRRPATGPPWGGSTR